MKRILRNIFLTNRFFLLGGVIVVLFALGYSLPLFLATGKAMLVILFLLVLLDAILLFREKDPVGAVRSVASTLSLGENHNVILTVTNNCDIDLNARVIDELPDQFQVRDKVFRVALKNSSTRQITYDLRPVTRGEYKFGQVQVFIRMRIGLVERRNSISVNQVVRVYPSIMQMKRLELTLGKNIAQYHGIKRIRKLGHSYEFEQIRNYQVGDEYRTINWKATSRRNSIMVNEYEDERSQQVYAVIDRSRSMMMPFNGLSLLDHAINTALVISNIALQKHDKAGLLTFANDTGTFLGAERSSRQLRRILEQLYREREGHNEANYEKLLQQVSHIVKGRSLLFLFTNFESHYAMKRVLPVLRRLNHMHLLVIMFFENTEISDFSQREAPTLLENYEQAVARNFVIEKFKIQQELQRYGIMCMQNRPEDLAINTINKYLELKSRGLI